MTHIDDFFPNKYLRAGDLGGDTTVTITQITAEVIGRDQQRLPMVHFAELEKQLVLNKTNGNTITSLYGGVIENWVGQRVTLFATQVDYQGQQVPAIRIRMTRPPEPPIAGGPAVAAPLQPAPTQPAVPAQPGHGPISEDEIPFDPAGHVPAKYRGKCQDLLELLYEWNHLVWHGKSADDIWHHVMLKMQHDGNLQPGRYLHEKVLIMEWKLQQRDEARQEANQ